MKSLDLTSFLEALKASKTSFVLAYNRPYAIMVTVAVPGERWEVEFFPDGEVETEIFVSHGMDHGESLQAMMERHDIA